MHLGYHELRNMLIKFKEDRASGKTGPPPPASASAASMGPSGGGAPSGGGPPRDNGYRPRDDGYRDRDRGQDRDRHSSRGYEYVDLALLNTMTGC
jgi:hypothetical protein